MGYGPVVNGKQRPITKWEKSWAAKTELERIKQKEISDAKSYSMGS
jgi:hypothetical protein